MEQLRKLDESATTKGMALAIIMGSFGALLLGIGMCCTMVWRNTLFAPGVVIGVVGIISCAAAYPLYLRITKKQREKLAPQIMELTNELLK